MAGMDHILAKGFLATGSAAYTFGQLVKGAAGSALQPGQVAPAVAGGSGDSAVGKTILGVCQENMDATKVATGKAYISVALEGVVDVVWDGVGTAAIGSLVVPSAAASPTHDGQVAFAAASGTFGGKPVVGICVGSAGDLQSGIPGAAGDLFKILLTPGNNY